MRVGVRVRVRLRVTVRVTVRARVRVDGRALDVGHVQRKGRRTVQLSLAHLGREGGGGGKVGGVHAVRVTREGFGRCVAG